MAGSQIALAETSTPDDPPSEFDLAARIEPPARYLSTVYRTGVMFTSDTGGPVVLDDTSTSLRDGCVLWRLARKLKPETIYETGFGRGGSAAFFLSAMYPWGGRLISIDPYRLWTEEVGVRYIERLGLSKFHTLIDRPSEIVLPSLALSRCPPSLRLSYVDGSHHFDGKLIDFMYLHRMTEVGGIIAIDDARSPVVRTLLSFVAHNLSYQIHFPTDRLVLCRKTAPDQRDWCHFRPFRSSSRSDWNEHEEPPDCEAIPGVTFGIE